MRREVALAAIATAVVGSGCAQVSSILPPAGIECGGTEAARCQQAAQLGIAKVNLNATGPIASVVLETLDCALAGKASFHSVWADAKACWRVDVTGKDSDGGGVVVMWPNGNLEPFW